MDPALVNRNSDRWCQQANEGPVDPAFQRITSLDRALQRGDGRRNRLIRDGGIVKGDRADEEAIARDAMRIRGRGADGQREHGDHVTQWPQVTLGW